MPDEKSVPRKRCTKCGEVKDLESGFQRDHNHVDGSSSQCRECDSRSGSEPYPSIPGYSRRAGVSRRHDDTGEGIQRRSERRPG